MTLTQKLHWNRKKREARITDPLLNIWEDHSNRYMIDLTDREEERQKEHLVEEGEAENIMFGNQDCEQLKKFMEAEADFMGDLKCDKCKKRDCVLHSTRVLWIMSR